MAISQWFESTFSSDKFDARKALRHTKKEYSQIIPKDSDFDEIFLELANHEINKTNRLLYSNEIDNITQRARVRTKHRSRSKEFSKDVNSPETKQTNYNESESYQTSKLDSEFYNRLMKQLESIKTTINLFLNEGEISSVRNLKLKTAEDTITKIVKEMNDKLKSKSITSETERTIRTEITRWTNLTQTINKRMNKKINPLDFKDYVIDFEKSFKNANL